jgi:hypothetical protein
MPTPTFIPTSNFGFKPYNPTNFGFNPIPNSNFSNYYTPTTNLPINKLVIGGQTVDTDFIGGLAGSFGIDLKAFFEKNPELAALIDFGLSKINLGDKKQSTVYVDKNVALNAFLDLMKANVLNITADIYSKNASLRNAVANKFVSLGGKIADFNLALTGGYNGQYPDLVITNDTYKNALSVVVKLEKELLACGVNVSELTKRGIETTYQSQVNTYSGINTGSGSGSGTGTGTGFDINRYLLPAAIVLAAFIFMRKK